MSDDKDENPWASYVQGVKKLNTNISISDKPKEGESKTSLKKDAIKELAQKVEALEKKEEKVELQNQTKPKKEKIIKKHPSSEKQPLDLRIERNMSLGEVMIEARLDLHGRTEQEAHEELKAFIEKNNTMGRRMLLVITGKSGILRTNMPRWCRVPPFQKNILAVRSAAQQHGGDGAYYVLLRKKLR